MIKLTKVEASHIEYTLKEIISFLYSMQEQDVDSLIDLAESSEEIVRACMCNNEIDETIN